MLIFLRARAPEIGFVFALLLLSSAGVTSYMDATRMARTGAEIDDVHRILETLDDVSIGVERVVTTARVFVLTGQEEFIAPLQQTEQWIHDRFTVLRQELDGSDLLSAESRLEELVERRIHLTRDYVEIRRRLDLQDSTEQIPPGGEDLTEAIRELVSEMEQEIEAQLDQSRLVAAARHSRTRATIVSFGSISLLILLGAFFVLRRQIAERAELEREVVVTGENERERIARDLHDGVGQELTGISLRLSALTRQLEREGSSCAETAQKLSSLVQASISETRRLSRSLSPSVWSDLGLHAALEALAREVDGHTGMTCTVECSPSARIDDKEVSAQLFRIAQEAVTNALRHSGATHIELRCAQSDGTTFIEVLDDGIGIPSPGERVEGLGLKSMRYRARMIEGRLDVSARREGGTRVRCSLDRTRA